MAVAEISRKADCILGAQQLGLQQIESQNSLKEATKWPISVHVHETPNVDCISYHEAWWRSKGCCSSALQVYGNASWSCVLWYRVPLWRNWNELAPPPLQRRQIHTWHFPFIRSLMPWSIRLKAVPKVPFNSNISCWAVQQLPSSSSWCMQIWDDATCNVHVLDWSIRCGLEQAQNG